MATLPPIGKPPIERHWRVPLRTAVVATLTVGAIGVSGAWLISRPPRAVFPPASLAVPQTLLSERDEPPAIPADARVLVRVTVDSSYRDGLPPDTVRLALLLPPRMVSLRGRTVSDVITEEYGLTSEMRAAREELERVVRAANPMLKEGPPPERIAVPAIPRLGMRDDLPPNLEQVEVSVVEDRLVSRQARRPGTEAGRRSSSTILDVWAPYRYFAEDRGRGLLELPTARALSFPLWIHPAQPNVRAGAGTCTVDPSPYNASFFDRPALQSRLQNGTRDVDLFVLESSWPDPASEASSRRELAARFANVRSELTFPTQPLQTAPQTSPGDPRSAHAREVMSSLAELAPLSPRVHVIFVPTGLMAETEDVIREVIYVGSALDAHARGHSALNTDWVAELQRVAQSETKQVLDCWGGQPSCPPMSPPSRPSLWTLIDGGYVSHFLSLASRTANKRQIPFTVSASWWAPVDKLEIKVPASMPGLVVAAAGNEGRDVENPLIMLAGISTRDMRVLAAMSLDGAGATYCNTSHIGYRARVVGAAGFYATVPGGCCGTSFAAPRIAWLLAAAETRRPAPAAPIDKWPEEVRDRLWTLRGSRQTPVLPLDPVGYLDAK